jgi:hypothetical protein
MPPAPEPSASPDRKQTREALAFGLPLEIEQRIEAPGLEADGGTAGAGPAAPTRVRIDPAEVRRRWDGATGAPRRVRELRGGTETLLTVDLREPAGYLLEARGVGRVLVSADGHEVLCDPLPDAPDWAFILTAQVLPLASTLRGQEVFHAAGVVVAGEAVLFAGEPGAGKSSLAAAFLRRGAGLLGDDAIALEAGEGGILAHPGVGSLHLREAEHERLSPAEREALGAPRPFASRQRYLSARVSGPVPLAALFLLERAAEGEPIEPLPSVDPFALLASTFNLSVRTPERLTRQLDMAAALASGGRVHRLRVIPGTDASRLAEIVERELLAEAA